MKLRNIAKFVTAFSVFAFGMSSNAYAHRIVHVEGTLYVIICDNNGGNFTFSGSQQGAGDVAGILCPVALNGTSGGTNTFEQAVPAPKALLRNKASGTTVKECPAGTHWYEPAKACVANGGHPD